MDLMSIRRGLMAQMASGGILGKLLEIVDAYTPSESGTYEHTFSYDGIRGAYIIITDPQGNIENAINSSIALVSMCYFMVYGSYTIRQPYTITYRSNLASSGYADYWTPTVSATADSITVRFASGTQIAYEANKTYYLVRVKQ